MPPALGMLPGVNNGDPTPQLDQLHPKGTGVIVHVGVGVSVGVSSAATFVRSELEGG